LLPGPSGGLLIHTEGEVAMTGQELTPFKVHADARSVKRENFDANRPTIEYRPVAFDLERIALAVLRSSYRSPITLLFPKENAHIKVVSDIAMTVELVHAVYAIDERDEPLAAAYETPEWYLRGVACFTSGGVPQTVPAHAFVTMRDSEIEAVELQVLCDDSLVFAEP
jgi:hypothetical protein